MNAQRAIILALDTIIRCRETSQGFQWTFDPQVPGILRDMHAMGTPVIALLDPSAFGLYLEGDEEREELAVYIETLFQAAGAPVLAAVHIAEDVSDPQPLWDLRRRIGFSLGRSVLIAEGEGYEALRHNAGLGRMEHPEIVFGQEVLAAAG